MSQNPNSPKSLVLKYLAIFTVGALGAAAYFATMVSVLTATIVFVASVEAGSIFAWLAFRENRSATNGLSMGKTVEKGVRKFQRDAGE